MENSRSICTGVQNQFGKQVASTWTGRKYDVCILAGLTISHRYGDPNKLKKAFDLTRDDALTGACLSVRAKNLTRSALKLELDQNYRQEWTINFNNFVKKLNLYENEQRKVNKKYSSTIKIFIT